MATINLRLIGLVGGVILLLGVLLIGSQYVSDLTRGASADVVHYDLLPPQITVTAEEYRAALEKIGEYQARTDLASKNELIQELKEQMSRWAN